MVGSVNVFKGVSDGLGSIEDAMYQTPLYGGITGAFNSIYDQCNEKVQNPTSQEDIIPLPVGSKYSTCVPPIVRIFGDGMGARAIPIVDSTGSIFSVEIIDGGFGYTSPPTISIVDNSGCGSGAQAKSIIDEGGTGTGGTGTGGTGTGGTGTGGTGTGSITSIYMTNVGSGYAQGNYTNIGIGTAGIGTNRNISNTGKVSGCIQNIIVIAPGYGYTTGDRITDGTNTYVPIVTPGSGAIIGIEPLRTPVCGFDKAPILTINTRSGVAADLVPIMKFAPIYTTVDQNQVNQQAAIVGITSVVDCI
jgi:hypothetical protein